MRKVHFHNVARSLLAGGICCMAAATQPVFSGTVGPNYVYSITPCRVLDTRIGSGVYAGALAPSEAIDIRVSNIVGTIVLQGGSGSGCPDIPSDATGVFANVIAVEATGSFNNDVGVQPWGSTSGATAVNYTPGIFATNNGIFVGTCYGQLLYGFPPPSGSCEQDLTLSNGAGGSAHLVVDITGFTRHY